jgi:hypothetical protein
MSELMKKILADKFKTRKRLANLPIEQKLTLMEKMRDRSRLLAANSLRNRLNATTPLIVVSGDVGVLSETGAHKWSRMPPIVRLFPSQSNTLQNSETLSEELKKQPEYWNIAGSEES